MKRILSFVFIIVMTLSVCMHPYNVNANNTQTYSKYSENMLQYLQEGNNKLLVLRSNYGYMSFVENFRSNVPSLYCINMIDKLIGTGAEPDEKKYMEVLINIIATYEADNAVKISEQHKQDNLKDYKDYAMDIAEMGKNAVLVMVGNNPAASELESSISTAINGIYTLADNTDNWIDALSDLETIVQDYSDYDSFLNVIENNSDGDLKKAASTLRKSFSQAMNIKLNTYNEVSNENFENYSEFFFEDVFLSAIKQTPEYASDDSLKFFVDSSDELLSKAGTLKDSWELGKLIGTLVGDIAVGGENLINRVFEMMAIYDISVILQTELIDLENDFLNVYGTQSETEVIDTYISYSQFLIGCRIRGEYCLYSTIANDAGLLSWFGKENAEEAKEWYEMKTKNILEIQNTLLKIKVQEDDIEGQEQIDNIAVVSNVVFEHSGYYTEFESAVISGYANDGTRVWQYETSKNDWYQCDVVEEIGINKKQYYFLDIDGLKALDIETGELLWINSYSPSGNVTFDFDNDGNLYIIGYLGKRLVKIDANGQNVFEIDTGEYSWAYNLEYNDGYVDILFEYGPNGINETGYKVRVDLNTLVYSEIPNN